ncbi:hypothetical protein [Helicobacter sp. 16-1353]|nr:hypothetical protein [Helicobacter sp. 16-1353]
MQYLKQIIKTMIAKIPSKKAQKLIKTSLKKYLSSSNYANCIF